MGGVNNPGGTGETERGTDNAALASDLTIVETELFHQHAHVSILFVIPEAVGSITADNIALQTELAKQGLVHTITQAEALDFPTFGIYALCVCGSNSGTAWTTSNLADLKTIIGLPIICVDKVSGAYFEIGTDGGDATTKTAIDVISEIEGTLLGIGDIGHETVTGLAAGANTVSASATYHTLDMSDANITEVVYATESVDVDGGSANTDVTIGMIPIVLASGAIGVDETGAEIPATLAFFGIGYAAATLNTLGLAAFYLLSHQMIADSAKNDISASAEVIDLRKRWFGNMRASFTNTDPAIEFLAGTNSIGTRLPAGVSLYDVVATLREIAAGSDVYPSGVANDSIIAMILAKGATATPSTYNNTTDSLEAISDAVSAIPTTMVGTDSAATVADGWDSALATILDNFTATRIGYLDNIAATAVGRSQIAAATIDLNQAAATYDLFTGTSQVVILESLNIKLPTGAAGGSLTSISIQTDDATPGVIISSADGDLANLTSEAGIAWTGSLYITVGTKIRLTIAGGAHGTTYTCNVTAKCRAVVAGGNLA